MTVSSSLVAGSRSDPAAETAGPAAGELPERDARQVDVDVDRALAGRGPQDGDDPGVERVAATRGEVLGAGLDGLGEPQADPRNGAVVRLVRVVVLDRTGIGRVVGHARDLDHELRLTTAQPEVDHALR